MADKTNPRSVQTVTTNKPAPEFSAAVRMAAERLRGPLHYEKTPVDRGFKDPKEIVTDDIVTYKEYLITAAAGEAGLKNPSVKVISKSMIENQMKDPAFAEKSLRQFKAWEATIAQKENPAQPENTGVKGNTIVAQDEVKPINMNRVAKQSLAELKEKFPTELEGIKDSKLKQKIENSLQWQEAGAKDITAPLPINALLELEKFTNPTAPKTGKRR